jgi:hypothetical protein
MSGLLDEIRYAYARYWIENCSEVVLGENISLTVVRWEAEYG